MLERQRIKRGYGQADKQGNATVKMTKGDGNRISLRVVMPFDCSRVLDTPMSRHRLPRPDGANLPRSVVADCEDKIKKWRIRRREFIPTLAVQVGARKALLFQQVNDKGVNASAGVATRAERVEPSVAYLIEN